MVTLIVVFAPVFETLTVALPPKSATVFASALAIARAVENGIFALGIATAALFPDRLSAEIEDARVF